LIPLLPAELLGTLVPTVAAYVLVTEAAGLRFFDMLARRRGAGSSLILLM